MFMNESEIVLCKSNPLSSDEFKTLRERIDEMYQVNLNLDKLLAIRYAKKGGDFIRWTGYPIGIKVKDVYDVFNHLKFTILAHRYEHKNVVGDSASLDRDIKWPSRWDAYLKMEGAKVHWFSILNSLMVITFLAGVVPVIFLRITRRDLAHYEELDEAQTQMNEDDDGSLFVSHAFKPPNHGELLCVMVAGGCRILGMAGSTIFFAALGFMSPASRGPHPGSGSGSGSS
ncbi:hypothetical protein L2E82_05978 [Cichorium intybus]|uniref:Uncharacterized protein n=1 Tax=Cichorium intybus TaxID=13427 RepID=A0ACB9H9W4_CICIN|nr:hypothetical protein L2E82_05978 [Cichorium intybus]